MSIPAGWYDDGHGTQRWWDGTQWTSHVQPASVVPPYAAEFALEDAPAAPAQSGRSKLWIAFVVLGVLLAGLVTAAALFLPRALTDFAAGLPAGAVPGDTDPDPDSVGPAAPPREAIDLDALTGDEATASQVVLAYDQAWKLADCDAFTAASVAFVRSASEYTVTITGITVDDDTAYVDSTETYLALQDEDGIALDTPQPATAVYWYELTPAADGWVIDYVGADE